jgi:hypothetical protein
VIPNKAGRYEMPVNIPKRTCTKATFLDLLAEFGDPTAKDAGEKCQSRKVEDKRPADSKHQELKNATSSN